MTALDSLAEFVHQLDLASLSPAAVDRIKLHLLDTLGAVLAGARLDDGIAIGRLVGGDGEGGVVVPGYGVRAGLGAAILAGVAAARCTEMDDIHLTSCTTPGSVIVPTALALASSGRLTSTRAFLAAIAVGYEVLIRLGLAIDGPALLGKRRLWPTLYAAPLGSAAVAARAYGLSTGETAGAFATALAMTSGTAIGARSAGSTTTSRWLTLGAAARNGLLAVRAAQAGIVGPRDLLEQCRYRVAGVRVSRKNLLAGSAREFVLEEVGLKPYPIARQALAAVEACRQLATNHQLEASAIEEILVKIPGPQRPVIDHPDVPESRIASIVSVQYQIALAIAAPERLADVRRTPPFMNDVMRELMARVRVGEAPELESYYPRAWPARVGVRSRGRWLQGELVHPPGDVESDFGWQGTIAKFHRVAGPLLDDPDEVVAQSQALDETSELPGFLTSSPAHLD